MDRSHSPLPDAAPRDHLPPRSPSPPQHYQQQHQQPQQPQHHQQEHFHAPPHPQHSYSTPPQHQYHAQHAYEADYPRPDSRLSDSRLLPPPSARHTPSGNAEEATPPASPPHKRYKHDNLNGEVSASPANGHPQQHAQQQQQPPPPHANHSSSSSGSNSHPHSHSQLPPPYPCHVDQRWVSARPVNYDSIPAANIAITDHRDFCRILITPTHPIPDPRPSIPIRIIIKTCPIASKT
ncbi:hypothetical protein FKP32DRAFT_1676128 [Trametes sanguinea]|nr:hypothetical protein FKP32DRAFT_1676128 [Trametes sanguinea]